VDTQTLLIVIAISAFALIAGLLIAFRRQTPKRMDKRVEATITQIAVEASSLSSWWRVTAEWVDPEAGRVLTFRSRRIKYPPHYRIGERVAVHFDTYEPKHYRMEL
jgi:hypothetical protein